MSEYTSNNSMDLMAETAEDFAKTTDHKKKKKKGSKKVKKYKKQAKNSKEELKSEKKRAKKKEKKLKEKNNELKHEIQLNHDTQTAIRAILTYKQLEAQGIDPLEAIIRNLYCDRKELPQHGDY